MKCMSVSRSIRQPRARNSGEEALSALSKGGVERKAEETLPFVLSEAEGRREGGDGSEREAAAAGHGTHTPGFGATSGGFGWVYSLLRSPGSFADLTGLWIDRGAGAAPQPLAGFSCDQGLGHSPAGFGGGSLGLVLVTGLVVAVAQH